MRGLGRLGTVCSIGTIELRPISPNTPSSRASGMAWIVKSLRAAMLFEWIRRIEPPAAQPTAPPEPVRRHRDAPELAELARAHARAAQPEPTSLACPVAPAQRLELPRFSGVSLADVALEISPPTAPPSEAATKPAKPPRYVTAPLPPQPRVLLGPGAMTMTLAIVATLVFGVLVVTH